MASIRVSTLLGAPPDAVWADVQDIATHVEWMADAEEIRFTSAQTQGVGTTFDCDTKVGPVRLTDKMAITAWEPNQVMGVRHEGVVTGTGAFTLEPEGDGQTRFTWEEELVFPWWLAGRLGASAGRPVLRTVWKRNLKKLQARFA